MNRDFFSTYLQCVSSRDAKNSAGPYLISRASAGYVLCPKLPSWSHKLLKFVRRRFRDKSAIFSSIGNGLISKAYGDQMGP